MITNWRYEEPTKTIRSVPQNHWIATMDSWDGAEDHAANARIIAAAPQLVRALESLLDMVTDNRTHGPEIDLACEALKAARD